MFTERTLPTWSKNFRITDFVCKKKNSSSSDELKNYADDRTCSWSDTEKSESFRPYVCKKPERVWWNGKKNISWKLQLPLIQDIEHQNNSYLLIIPQESHFVNEKLESNDIPLVDAIMMTDEAHFYLNRRR